MCVCGALLSVFVYVFLFSSASNSSCHRVLSVTVVCIKQLEVGFGSFPEVCSAFASWQCCCFLVLLSGENFDG